MGNKTPNKDGAAETERLAPCAYYTFVPLPWFSSQSGAVVFLANIATIYCYFMYHQKSLSNLTDCAFCMYIVPI